MKRQRQILKSTILSIFLMLFVSVLHAQDRNITGQVTDETGEAVPGVSIVVSGTVSGTISGADGSYSLTVPAGATHLMFSFIGMRAARVAFSGVVPFIVAAGVLFENGYLLYVTCKESAFSL